MEHTRIAFVGAGNMASSLMSGLIARGVATKNIFASDPLPSTRENIASQYGVHTTASNREIVQNADVVILAVKPQAMKTVACDLAAALGHQTLTISIAAGVSLASLQRWLGDERAIVRCMPNTPALLQLGATGMYANEYVNEKQKLLAKQVMEAVGISVWLDKEADIDAVTALSGSGPAYYFLLMESMIRAGIALGLDAEVARKLTLQTALGAATMATESGETPTELRRKVSSPKGTTEQAIRSLQENHFEEIMQQALEAAQERAVELSREIEKDG